MSRRGVKRKAPEPGRLPNLDEYAPALFIRCHNQRDDDDETKIWKCAFEPSLDDPNETTNLLASCGGKTVCIIDVKTEQVLKRFRDVDKNENFYTLAWTTIENSNKKKVNILAVAGEGASIKLIYPNQLLMYALIRGHKKYISCLCFHPKQTRLLFSGSRDGFVYLWDIGIPDNSPSTNYSPLLKISVQDSVGDALNLAFCESSDLLIAGAERGCVGWKVQDAPLLSPVRRARSIEKPDVIFQHPKSKHTTIDGLIKLPGDLIATKQVGSGEILIWDVMKHIAKVNGTSKDVAIEPIIKLRYPNHNIKYLNLGFSNGLLGVGDEQGSLLLYNLKEVLNRREQDEDEDSVWDASLRLKIGGFLMSDHMLLEWPNITNNQDIVPKTELVVNTVAISSSHQYVTGGTDNNLVCIWKRDESEDGVATEGSPTVDPGYGSQEGD